MLFNGRWAMASDCSFTELLAKRDIPHSEIAGQVQLYFVVVRSAVGNYTAALRWSEIRSL